MDGSSLCGTLWSWWRWRVLVSGAVVQAAARAVLLDSAVLALAAVRAVNRERGCNTGGGRRRTRNWVCRRYGRGCSVAAAARVVTVVAL